MLTRCGYVAANITLAFCDSAVMLLWTQSTSESIKAALSKGMRSSIFSPMPA